MQLVYLRYLDYHNKGPPNSITALFHRVNVSSITDLGFCDRKEVPCTARPQDWYFNTKYLAILTYFLSPFGHSDILSLTIWPYWKTVSRYLAIYFLSLFGHTVIVFSHHLSSLTIIPLFGHPIIIFWHYLSIPSFLSPTIWPYCRSFLLLFGHTLLCLHCFSFFHCDNPDLPVIWHDHGSSPWPNVPHLFTSFSLGFLLPGLMFIITGFFPRVSSSWPPPEGRTLPAPPGPPRAQPPSRSRRWKTPGDRSSLPATYRSYLLATYRSSLQL